MAKYPIKLLKDKDGTAFIPVVNSDSIITPEGDTLNDLLEEKQDLLTSGTNIKTINNESLLGSGNISIQGSGDATDVQVNGVSITQNNVANIATQTAYNSLTNKIATKNDIPTQTSQLTNDSGYTTNTGTITKVQANGTDVASSGTANIPAATTSKYGVTKLSSATNSTSEVLAATPKAVKAAYDLAASKGTGTITGVSVNGTSVATSGVANITSVPASVLSGAIPSAVTATTQTSSDNSTKIATTAFVKTAIDNLPEPMVFKGSLGTGGTITSLPTNGTATVGDTYKVITDGTYASKAAKVGDTFICLTKTSSANTWELIPSGDDIGGTVTSVKINATSPIVIDNNATITTSGERTISHANSGVTAGTYKSVTVDSKGHITSGTNPTTLSGYGITDAKISNGTITLGSNTITPSTVTNIKNGSAACSLRSIGSSPEDTNYTIGTYAFSEGNNTKASGSSSHAEGYNTTASGDDGSHAEGYNTTASGDYGSHAEGYNTTASGDYGSHAEGNNARAIGSSSHTEGSYTFASQSGSHAEGWGTIASGKYSHAEGGHEDGYLFSGTVVAIDTENQTYEVSGVPKVDDTLSDSAIYSGAVYSKTNYINPERRIVSAARSSETDNVTFTVSSFDPSYIAVGNSFRLFAGSKASGKYSHAEGYGVCATGLASHAEGYYTIASETGSHAGGYYTKAKSSYQTTVGKYNDNKNNTLFEVGNGTADNARSNAFEVYSDGRAIVGADPTTAMGVATKQYVDNAISLPQVTDSYSASTTDSYSCNYVNGLTGKILYENPSGTSSSFSLSEDWKNFKEIEVYFLAMDWLCNSSKMDCNSQASLVLAAPYGEQTTSIVILSVIIQFSGTTVSFTKPRTIIFDPSYDVPAIIASADIKVTKVIGYR